MLDTELMSVVATLFEERSILSLTSISFWHKKSGRVPALAMVTSLPYRRSMCSCPLPHHGDFVFGSLDHWGLWHRWNFKQSKRSLWDWVPRPKTVVRLKLSFNVLPKSKAYCKAVETSLMWWTTECRFSTSNVMQLWRLVASYPSSSRFFSRRSPSRIQHHLSHSRE